METTTLTVPETVADVIKRKFRNERRAMDLDLKVKSLPVQTPPNCPDSLAADIGKYNQDVDGFSQRRAKAEAEVVAVPLAMLDTPAAKLITRVEGAQAKLLEVWREQAALLVRREQLCRATKDTLQSNMVEAEAELDKARETVVKHLAKAGVTLENEPAFGAAPEAAKNAYQYKINQTPAVRQAVARIQDCQAVINRAATEARAAKDDSALLTGRLGKAVQKLLLAHMN